jgi:hypothetical protein
MQDYENKTGGNVTAIPHNGNLSNGMMFALQDDFADGAALDAAYAEARQKWERLYEATQMKGDGEAHPLLSPDDAFADFENWDMGNLDLTELKTPEMLPGEYARSGLKRGLELEATLGVNPFKFGMIGASDTHVGMTTMENENFFHKFTTYEPSPDRVVEDGEIHMSNTNADGSAGIAAWQYITSGLTAVWATENSRGALFDAMERREVYATTGNRLRLRFFGGWEFEDADANTRNLAQVGYGKGVPMGADLPARPDAQTPPRFLVYALRDPMGANIDRIQIVKGWLAADGTSQERVYDVAWSDQRVPDGTGALPPVGDTVDLSVPTWTNTIGAPELAALWTDPEFDPDLKAFYYARVIEIPTPRWTAYDRVKFGLEFPDSVPLKGQERAYSSPIWYAP